VNWARDKRTEGCFLDAKNQVGGLKRRVHLRTRTNILLQWKDSTLTLLYEHAYTIPADQLCDGIWCEGSPALPYTPWVFTADPNGNCSGLRQMKARRQPTRRQSNRHTTKRHGRIKGEEK
jgi:hypothetical protein